MSAYSETQTLFTDVELLCDALREMGYQPLNCIDAPRPLVGFQGDYRTLDGEGHTKDASKALKAHVIIPRAQVGGASNDVGFVKGPDGKFQAIISDYDSRRHNPEWLKKLRTAYGVKGIERQAKRAGFRALSKKQANGKVEFEFIRA